MKKKILKISGIIILVLIIAIALIPFVFKNDIHKKVQEQLDKNLNAKVSFSDFGVSLFRSFPNLNFKLTDFRVIGINEFEKDTLVDLKGLYLSVDLTSVFGKIYKVNSIVLDEPNVNLIALKNGHVNWDIVKPTPPSTPEAPTPPSPFKLSLKEFKIKDAHLRYADAGMAVKTELENFNFLLAGNMDNDITDLDFKLSADRLNFSFGGIPYLKNVKLAFKSTFIADLKTSKYTFKENELALNQLILGFDGFVQMNPKSIAMDIALKAKETAFKNILSLIPAIYAKDFETIKTSGKLALDVKLKGNYADSIMPAFNVNLLVENAMFQYPSLPKSVDHINIKVNIANADGILDHTIVDVSKCQLSFGENPIDMTLHVTTPISDPNLTAALKGKIDLSSMRDFIPMEKDDVLGGLITADIKLNGKMSSVEKKQYDQFKAEGLFTIAGMLYKTKDVPYGVKIEKLSLNFTPQFVELSQFDALLGKSDIHLKGRVDNVLGYVFKKEMLKGTFKLSSTFMDLNQFASKSTEPAKVDTAKSAPLSIIEVPANLDVVLMTDIKRMVYDNMDITNLTGDLSIANSAVQLSDMKMNMLDGQLGITGEYATLDIKKPTINFGLNIQNFDIPKSYKTFNTIKAMAPVAENATGKFSTALTLKGILDKNMKPVMNSLSGSGKLQTKEIAIANSKTFSQLAEKIKMNSFKNLKLSDINCAFKFSDGKITVDPFDVKVGSYKANIKGSHSFDQTMDYTMAIAIPKADFGGAANSVLSSLTSGLTAKGLKVEVKDPVNVGVKITGKINEPKVGLDMGSSSAAGTVKDEVKTQINAKKEEVKAEVVKQIDIAKQQAEQKAKDEADRIKREAEQKAKDEADKAKKKAIEDAKSKLKGFF